MENCGFGYQNRVLDGVLSADAQADQLPVGNLASPQGSAAVAWRVPGTTGTLTLTLPISAPLRVFSFHRTNLTAAAQGAVTVRNAGTIVHEWVGLLGMSNGQAVYIAPQAVTGDTVTITLNDASNSDGFLSLPLAYIGPLWQPVRNFSTDSTAGFASGVDEATALSGAEYPQARWIQRKASIAHQSYGTAEVQTLREICRLGTMGRNILFVPDPASDVPAQDALFGRLSGGDLSNPFGPADRRALTFTLTERL